MDNARSAIIIAGAAAEDAWWPSTLFRSGDPTALTLGPAFGLRRRQTQGFLTSVLQQMGLELPVLDHTTLNRRARAWRSAGGRERRKIPTKEVIHVLVDNTELEVYGTGQ